MIRRLSAAIALSLIPLIASASERVVSKSDLGDRWPLTVDSGTLRCRPFRGNLQILTIEVDGKVWAVNGTAIGQGFPEINPIWKGNPEIPGAKINIGPLIDLAKSLCG
ncbi:YebY family protein [Tahibacter caeni]|uniref:YebY family protein n=1 Tax=Tahibacter caeni TaxID=1453545 RepID=UPI002147A45D|nr:YebY family protein [Tahibacter caeni]